MSIILGLMSQLIGGETEGLEQENIIRIGKISDLRLGFWPPRPSVRFDKHTKSQSRRVGRDLYLCCQSRQGGGTLASRRCKVEVWNDRAEEQAHVEKDNAVNLVTQTDEGKDI